MIAPLSCLSHAMARRFSNLRPAAILLGSLLALYSYGYETIPISDFTPKAVEWVPGQDSPQPRVSQKSAGKIFFQASANTFPGRAHWVTQLTTKATPGDCLILEASVPKPEALGKVMFYLRSSSAWFAISKTLRNAEPTRWILPIGSFAAEKPTAALAHQADLFRLAIHPSGPAAVELYPQSLRLVRPDVILVTATGSARSSSQRALAKTSQIYLQRWMDLAAIPYGIITDEQVIAGSLANAKLALFAYNPEPSAKEFAAIHTFIQGGGKVAVWYPEGTHWATVMGVKNTRLLSSKDVGHFSSIRFADSAFPTLRDPAWNILQAQPAGKTGKIAATWQTAYGKNLDISAVVQTPAGWWFSSPPRAGDPGGKSDVLTRLAGAQSKAAWREASTAAISFGTPSVPGFPPDLALARKAFQNGYFEEAWQLAQKARQRAEIAYALSRPPIPFGMHAVWDHNGTGLQAGAWDKTCAQLARGGINTIFSNVMWANKAHYPSKRLSESDTLKLYGDQLKQLLDAARPHAMDVHVWKVCWQMAGASAEQLAPFKKAGRLQQTADGKDIPWLNPCLPENWRFEIDAMKEVVSNYAIQGIHLDYVRFPDRLSCYSPATRKRYEEFTGRTASDWPRSVKPGGTQWKSYARFRASQITQFVRQASKELKAQRKDLKISIAVWGKYPDCMDAVGQDWPTWLKEGLVDFVTPMNYSDSPWGFESLLREQLALPGARGRIIPGIGVTANECELFPSEVLQQISLARKHGCDGFALFKLDANLLQNVLPTLGPALRP